MVKSRHPHTKQLNSHCLCRQEYQLLFLINTLFPSTAVVVWGKRRPPWVFILWRSGVRKYRSLAVHGTSWTALCNGCNMMRCRAVSPLRMMLAAVDGDGGRWYIPLFHVPTRAHRTVAASTLIALSRGASTHTAFGPQKNLRLYQISAAEKTRRPHLGYCCTYSDLNIKRLANWW